MKNMTFGYYTMMTMLVMASTMTACKKLIEIPPNPPTQITAEQQFADSATTMTAMANIYSYNANTNGFTFDDGYLDLCGGLSSDEISATTGESDDLQFYEYGVTRFNDYVSSMWSDPYSALYPVNAALSGIAASSGLPGVIEKPS